MFKKLIIVSALLLSMSNVAQAEVITFGDLSTDAQYNVIADTVKGREYLRFDAFDMTYAQTVVATSAGGIYEDWSIADSYISDDFVNALFSQNTGNPCIVNVESSAIYCGALSNWSDGLLGNSYTNSTDYFYYINSYSPTNAGYVEIRSDGSVTQTDIWSSASSGDQYNINFLLYRENSAHLGAYNINAAANNIVGNGNSASVPLPASGGLLAMAMGLFGFMRKYKK